jgi:hypothetical protein
MAGTRVWASGEVLSAADLNGNFNKLPYAMAAGIADSMTGAIAAGSAVGSITITFPTSRFNVPPIIQCWTGNNRYLVAPTALAAGSATVAVRNVSAENGNSEIIYWTAVQMTAGTAAG